MRGSSISNVVSDSSCVVTNVDTVRSSPSSISINVDTVLNGDTEEASDPMLEWVQCEDCTKWFTLPQGVTPDELPDVFVCGLSWWDCSLQKINTGYKDDWCGKGAIKTNIVTKWIRLLKTRAKDPMETNKSEDGDAHHSALPILRRTSRSLSASLTRRRSFRSLSALPIRRRSSPLLLASLTRRRSFRSFRTLSQHSSFAVARLPHSRPPLLAVARFARSQHSPFAVARLAWSWSCLVSVSPVLIVARLARSRSTRHPSHSLYLLYLLTLPACLKIPTYYGTTPGCVDTLGIVLYVVL